MIFTGVRVNTSVFKSKQIVCRKKNLNNQGFENSNRKDDFIKDVLHGIYMNKEPQWNAVRKKIVIDFSSPNIAKPFHFGHLRSTIIGNFIANLYQHFHHDVIRINYLGDWGTQFGLLQYGLKAKNIKLEELKNNPVKKLYDVYVYANKLSLTDSNVHEKAKDYFSKIEKGETNLENWKKIREITVIELEQIYQRLGINFDVYQWESDYNRSAIKDLIESLEEKNIIFTDKSGKKVARVNNQDVIVMKSDNSTLYLTRDIAALLDRYNKYKFDEMLYVVDNGQANHFSTLFDIVQQIDKKCKDVCKHIAFGKIKGMSTREGNVVFLNNILDEAKQKVILRQQQSKNARSSAMNEVTCDILGTTAVIIHDLVRNRLSNYDFNWDKVLQIEGQSGIKLQYVHCRLCSLEKNCGVGLPDSCDPKYLTENVIFDVVKDLANFENILQQSLNEYQASVLVNYLFCLTKHVNRMFMELKVKNQNTDLAKQRLLVFHCARLVIKKGMELLGVRPLHEM